MVSDTTREETESPVSGQSTATVRLTVTTPPFTGTYINKQEPAIEVLTGHIAIHSCLCEQLGVAPLSLVRLVSNKLGPAELKGLIIQPHKESLDKVCVNLN